MVSIRRFWTIGVYTLLLGFAAVKAVFSNAPSGWVRELERSKQCPSYGQADNRSQVDTDPCTCRATETPVMCAREKKEVLCLAPTMMFPSAVHAG